LEVVGKTIYPLHFYSGSYVPGYSVDYFRAA